MNDFLKKKPVRLAIYILSILAWLLLWELLARLFDFEVLFPGPIKTLKTAVALIGKAFFWKSVGYSLYRILSGLFLGILIGVLLTLIGRALPFLRSFISIGMSVVKSTPIASIVLILWALVEGGANEGKRLPIIIAVLMVSPIIWQNLTDGFNSIDKSLIEVARVFKFSKLKTVKNVYLPSLTRHFVPAVLTSIGFAWKSGISAEVIAYTKSSIGYNIANAKADFDGDILFAWTLVVVLISITLECLAKYFLRRFKSQNAYD